MHAFIGSVLGLLLGTLLSSILVTTFFSTNTDPDTLIPLIPITLCFGLTIVGHFVGLKLAKTAKR